ncbi:MAG: phosphotransferase [Vicinamibacteraceae bacterium]|nr:phosphotransferase [Vicinamibacteraceae bacterium]
MPSALDEPGVRDRVVTFLARTGLTERGARVVPLTGDASDRRYFRVLVPGDHSRVLAVHSGPIDFSVLPFVNVARLLHEMPVPVPQIFGHEDDLGILALEDLGDVTLQAHLGAAPSTDHVALYRQAVSHIATLQKRGADLASDRHVPYGIAFDVEKLSWEMDFFVKHFLEAYRGAILTDGDRAALRAELTPIVEELAAEPRVLCHRDYHSRNLMLHAGELFIIDFQDARMGPDTYDLVSLLRDSYVDLGPQLTADLIAYFLAVTGRPSTEREFLPRFDLMAVQRNLKALGTFGYQTAVRRNPVYIQYIPRTLRYVHDTLERYPRFARLRELLAEHIEELR